jgi:hypothetical protein
MAVGAAWLARRDRSAGLEPMSGLGPVVIGLLGASTSVALLLSVGQAVGFTGVPMIIVGAVVGGAALLFGILLAYGASRLVTDGAKWPAGLATLVLAIPLAALQLSPVLLAGTPAFPDVIDESGGRRPLGEIIPAQERGGARLTVTEIDTDVMFGIEGFVSFVKATRDGTVVLDQRIPASGISYSLPAGDYELEGYTRSCNGWCGELDSSGTLCSVSATLEPDTAYELIVSLSHATCDVR